MYTNLKKLGIINPEAISHYTLRQEGVNDILKIYFHKEKGEFFARSLKFKYPRQRKTVTVDSHGDRYKEVKEINPVLLHLIEELDKLKLTQKVKDVELSAKILTDLKHLQQVINNKIAEIEMDIHKLQQLEKERESK
ncbi:DUF3461 family protein [Candidatus Schmidhempelia bombi]|uniref:DUF3461 family protein n=1 Tax=Candidatus Schmidhempelia bombi str. Bimp TaxID=1387197 RepID=A0AB94IEN8_9GAMM|nr:DUF3461 family protein [Candidatus Schmidhempelia bombi]TEA27956.1 DUF3461 family protein [Candidatus Schmidhempelia bombi str. Bimp]